MAGRGLGVTSLRIGIVAPPWVPVPPPKYGGTEQVIDSLARGFLAAGHDVLLWTTGDATCPVPRGHVLPEAPGITGITTTELHHAINAHRALAEWGADVIHDHTLTGPAVARIIHDIPTLSTLHGEFDEPACSIYSTVAPHVGLIAISNDQASRAGDIPIRTVIPHGIDVDAFHVGSGSGDEHGAYFAFLGRMAPQKGVHIAARAARETGQRLIIAAKMREEPEEEYFRTQVRPLLGDGVTYIGEVDHDGRVALLQNATALMNPIKWPEPFGLVMVEALACGTPVIAFRSGSAPEIVEHGVTGFVCDDEEELAKRLGAANRLDRSACRTAAETRFSLRRMVDDHLELFREVLSEAAR